MAVSKDKKKEIYSEVADAVKASPSVAFVNFHGLPVAETTAMRKALHKKGISYKVAKKTIVKRVLADSGVSGVEPAFEGELALVYGDDLIAPAREVYAFQKTYKDAIRIIGGIFEGRYMDQAAMTDIAEIPSQNVLYGQFVNLINSPIQQFVVALGQIAKKREV
ncbi:MAG: 50S ribosomal protein L10 [Candidatus Lloydbacteria bacterium CG22_combo_CG10-13_8_21_14_all_47_15]|uniref:Large ribosomal subunit protein uL10 n=1 Tax=Candidatus Lloydbacteria bacterium CG22_combo_CG10-13_8_21_14_all_47_15 TaxID=1974635 RepID=A0A2H0CUG4_9BACT|nr:MAG: 50S ribosomal protein L10 [Candidatus Lloydbacteria bacterium CG22_combo_CG10-13_8_21_14_all_47_15]